MSAVTRRAVLPPAGGRGSPPEAEVDDLAVGLRRRGVGGGWEPGTLRGKGGPRPPLGRLPALLPAGVPLGVGTAGLPSQVRDGPPATGIRPFGDQRNPLALAQALEWLRGGRK